MLTSNGLFPGLLSHDAIEGGVRGVQETRLMMGMPIRVEVAEATATQAMLDKVFDYFHAVDERFSTYKATSEISQINRGELRIEDASDDMRLIFVLAEQTRQQTFGYFDIARDGLYDPSGIVKGWAIRQAADILRREGCQNFIVDAGGDVQVSGRNRHGEAWRAGIRNPFDLTQIVKVLSLTDCGVATSGSYSRGQHIYKPLAYGAPQTEIVSLTVVGPDVYEADRFATAAFAMGRAGVYFVETLDGFEGYMIDAHGQATLTTGFEQYIWHEA